MSSRLLLTLTLVIAVPAAAQHPAKPGKARKPAAAAKAFTLDVPLLPQDESVAVTSPSLGAPGPKAADAGPFTLDTPIEQLLADPRAKTVLDRDLPGLSEDENLPRFRAMSLRQFQPLTGGQLTNALLAKTAEDLADPAAAGWSPRPSLTNRHRTER